MLHQPTAPATRGRAPRGLRAGLPVRLAALGAAATLAACADGPGATGVTGAPGQPRAPRISADVVSTVSNGKIAFVSNRDEVLNNEIYVMNPDGSAVTRLTNYSGVDEEPAWSPDGSKIAFRRNVANADGGMQGDIFVMNADGSGQTNITDNPDFEGGPAWSPDGTRIAFHRNHDDNEDVYVMNADGSGQTRLTTELEPDTDPDWSPDGTRIAFISLRDDPGDEFFKDDVFVMNADGSSQTNLTTSTAGEFWPAWSPDGTKIAYARLASRGSHAEIFVMSADGSNPTYLTNNSVEDIQPAWSPDGTRLAFSSASQIWTMNPDGSGLSMLTSVVSSIDPAWQPLRPYPFDGFFPPVDNLPMVNVAKAGSGIPVKFSLGGDRGLDIFLDGFPKFVAEPCDPSDQQAPLEATTDSPSGLTYDPVSGRYIYVWKTSRELAGRCGRLELGLTDGSAHAALFRFTR